MSKYKEFTNPKVNVFGTNEQNDVDVDVTTYVALARLVLARENVMLASEMSLIFCDEEEISALNKSYMDKDGPTDVLSFPIDDDLVGAGRNPDNGGRGPGTPSEADNIPAIIGDVYICPKVANAQCGENNKTYDQEMRLLVVHGTLHLLGYDHMEDAERAQMQERENAILAEFEHITNV